MPCPLQVTELQKKSTEVHTVLEEGCSLAERLVSDRIGKQGYMDSESSNQSRLSRLQGDIEAIVKAL